MIYSLKSFPFLLIILRSKTQPLPFNLHEDAQNQEDELFNKQLLNKDEFSQTIEALQSLKTYKVKVYFYIKIDDWEPKYSEKARRIYNKSKKRLEFVEESVGVGSPISLAITAINKFLLENIACMSAYFAVAQEITNDDRVIGSTSNDPVHSYTLVKLCKTKDINQSMSEDNKKYDDIFVNSERLSLGEYCSFDLMEATIKAAFIARIRAIKKTGIKPQEYLNDLCISIEEKYLYRQALDYLKFYPFSLQVMEDSLNETILKKYHTWDQETKTFVSQTKNKTWSVIAYQSHLSIAEAYLQEGLYRKAKPYLDIVKTHIESGILDDFMLIAKYYLSQFRYCYHSDLEEKEEAYKPFGDRAEAIREAADCLDKAEENLKNF